MASYCDLMRLFSSKGNSDGERRDVGELEWEMVREKLGHPLRESGDGLRGSLIYTFAIEGSLFVVLNVMDDVVSMQ